MKKTDKKFYDIFIRYFILVLAAIPGLDLFYFLFSKITTYPVVWGLEIFYDTVFVGHTIFIGSKIIEIVGACVAGSAYFFLLILCLSTPNIEIKRRLKIIGSSFLIFLLINIIRIYILSLMYVAGSPIFDAAHKLFWYLGSTVFVVLIWFLEVKFYKIKDIPIYTDLKFIYKQSSLCKRKKKRK